MEGIKNVNYYQARSIYSQFLWSSLLYSCWCSYFSNNSTSFRRSLKLFTLSDTNSFFFSGTSKSVYPFLYWLISSNFCLDDIVYSVIISYLKIDFVPPPLALEANLGVPHDITYLCLFSNSSVTASYVPAFCSLLTLIDDY